MNIYERTALGVVLGTVLGGFYYVNQQLDELRGAKVLIGKGWTIQPEAQADAVANARAEGHAEGYAAASVDFANHGGPCKCCKCEACQCNAIEREKARTAP